VFQSSFILQEHKDRDERHIYIYIYIYIYLLSLLIRDSRVRVYYICIYIYVYVYIYIYIFVIAFNTGLTRTGVLYMCIYICICIYIYICKGKGKVTPKQAYVALRGPGGKAPGFLDYRHIKVVRLSALRTGRLHPQEYLGIHFERLSRTRAHGLVGKNRSWDLPTSSAVP
jgi:hypothetical protein